LRGTLVTDAGLSQLAGLKRLEALGLGNTRVTDAGLVRLRGMTRLQHLHLRGTRVTEAAVEELQKSLPKASITHSPKESTSPKKCLRAHPSFKEYWLDGLRFIDGDLAIGNRRIADASPEEIKKCTSIATERHIAAYWLQGSDETYSKVIPATLLSAC
jgi:hypothetical protein